MQSTDVWNNSGPGAVCPDETPEGRIPGPSSGAKKYLGMAMSFVQMVLKKVPDVVDENPIKMAFSIARAIIDIKDVRYILATYPCPWLIQSCRLWKAIRM